MFRIGRLSGGYLIYCFSSLDLLENLVVKVLVGLVMLECRLSGGYLMYCFTSLDLLENLVVKVALVGLVMVEYLLRIMASQNDVVRRSCSEITKSL